VERKADTMADQTELQVSEEAESISTHNRYVAEAIKSYCRFPHSQGFAVMVDGPWGSGKTRLIKSLMDDLIEQKSGISRQKPLYISLYGICANAEIDEQIYQQLHPVLSHRYTRVAAAVFKGLMKTAVKIDLDSHHDSVSINSQFPELKMSDVVDGAAQRVVIFDDLERAVMSPVDVLGYINPFVEHDGCKVIILANEKEILTASELADKSDRTYKLRKEKTIGRTLRVKADVEAAFEAFLGEIDNPEAKRYLTIEKSGIITVFKDSTLENLRLLKSFLWDFERFWLTLTGDQKAHNVAMREVLTLLCAATLELRSGNMDREAFKRSDMRHYMRMQAREPDSAVTAAEGMFRRYPSVKFDSTLLAPETIIEIVLESTIRTDDIQSQIQAHPYFMSAAALPSWRALWHSFNLDAAGLAEALQRFEADFTRRNFQDYAEILHVTGLSLWLSDRGQPGWGASCIVTEIERYIDDVYQTLDADFEHVKSFSLERLSGGAYGLGFLNREDPRFANIARHLDDAIADWRRRRYPKVATRLKRLMIEDSEAFLRDICFTNAGPSTYARSAVLSHIPATEFVVLFISLPFEAKSQIMMALSIRYDHVPGEPELQSELPWLADVYDEVQKLTNLMPSIPRYHIQNLTKQYVLKHITPSPAS
jgi:hypothetical protein